MGTAEITQLLSNVKFESDTVVKVVSITFDKLIILSLIISLTLIFLSLIFKGHVFHVIEATKTFFQKKK